jgi:vacuolar-type H+-ATPase subunit H
MSDVNKTISIQYRAEVQNLVNGLKKVGNVSEKEAQKLVNQLDKAYTKAARDAQKSAAKQERALKGVGKTAKGVGQGIQASFSNISIAAGAAAVAVLAFGQHIADMSNQLVDASTKTGVNTDTLHGLRLAAEGAGVSFEELEMGLVKLPSLMQKSADGSKSAKRAFEALGVQTTETVDGFEQLRSADDVLKDIFHSLQQIESAEEKAARAADIFGRTAGPKFIQSGAIDNLDAFVSLANEFGVASGPEMQKQMADFQRISATATEVITGEMMRLLDVMAGGSGGSGGGLNDIIMGATQAFIIFGELSSITIKSLQHGLGGTLASLNVGVTFLTGTNDELERAKQLFREFSSEAMENAEKIIDPIGAVTNRLEEFNTAMQATMASPKNGGGGGGAPTRRGGGASQVTQQTTKAVDELAKAMKMVEDIENKTLAAMVKTRDERVAQLTGEEKILALRDIALQKIHEEKQALTNSVRTQIEKLQGMKQTQEVLDTIANLEFVHEEEMMRLKDERKRIIKEAFDENNNLILETAELEIEKDGEVLEKQLENDNKRKKSAREVFDEIMKGSNMVVEGLNVAADLIDQNAIKNKHNAELVFNIRKAAAIADIAIQTAKNIVEVAPLGPLAMLAMAGIGTAQGALVASEQPKFHMGGMIGGGGTLAPDETMVTAKRGEAILSTAAVNRIGEDGVRSLETGGGITPKIIVMNPFKHYDRFIRGRDAMGMSAIQGTGRKGY